MRTGTPAIHAAGKGRASIAVRWYLDAVRLDPSLVKGWLGLGDAYLALGQTDKARSAYAEAWALGDPDAGHVLAKIMQADGDHGGSTEIWHDLLAGFPEDTRRLVWWQRLTNGLRSSGKPNAGLSAAKAALLEFPHDAVLHMELGLLLYEVNQDAGEAIDEILTSIQLDKSRAASYAAIANIMETEGNYQEAFDWYSQALQLDPNRESWLIARAHMSRVSGDLQTAERLFKEATDLHPNSPAAYLGLARTFHELGEKKKTIEAIEGTVERSANVDGRCLSSAGLLYEQMGELERALAAFQLALDINPQDSAAQKGIQRLSE